MNILIKAVTTGLRTYVFKGKGMSFRKLLCGDLFQKKKKKILTACAAERRKIALQLDIKAYYWDALSSNLLPSCPQLPLKLPFF